MNIVKFELLRKLVDSQFAKAKNCLELNIMYVEAIGRSEQNASYTSLRFLELINPQSELRHSKKCFCKAWKPIAKTYLHS